ncbi:hypothetical protein [Fictibacillus arsenicus]|nr:hypothetical protein [Fictibacillus arsenicus]
MADFVNIVAIKIRFKGKATQKTDWSRFDAEIQKKHERNYPA